MFLHALEDSDISYQPLATDSDDVDGKFHQATKETLQYDIYTFRLISMLYVKQERNPFVAMILVFSFPTVFLVFCLPLVYITSYISYISALFCVVS